MRFMCTVAMFGKGTDIPYFSHLMAVAATVIENGGSENEAIAGLLHDAVEDQGGRPRLKDIEDRFGSEVATIVEACSDSLDGAAGEQKADWLERKRQYLRGLAKKNDAILRVSIADKLHNARAIYRDAKSGGPEFWKRFNKPAEQTIAYYSAIYSILRKLSKAPIMAELGEAIEALKSLIKDKAAHKRWVQDLLGSKG